MELTKCRFCSGEWFDQSSLLSHSGETVCKNCFGFLSLTTYEKFSAQLTQTLSAVNDLNGKRLSISIYSSPLFDILKSLNSIMISSLEGKSDFSRVDILMRTFVVSVLERDFPMLKLCDSQSADFSLDLGFEVAQAVCQICSSDEDYRPKKKKQHNEFIKSDISQVDADHLVSRLKLLSMDEIQDIGHKLSNFFCQRGTENSSLILRLVPKPLYLMGRYCKYARDVPQSPWSLALNDDDLIGKDMVTMVDDKCAADKDSTSMVTNRKGRYSVEEIICNAVNHFLACNHSRLHGCGREDIDVRCLGSGRPFVLEIRDCFHPPSPALLQEIVHHINAGEGINDQLDVSVAYLRVTDKSLWESMQELAETKKKKYCCVVWSKQSLNRSHLQYLAEISGATAGMNVDENGDRGLEIHQRTPLRVLHRRSSMTRSKYIYDMEGILLNPHYLLLSFVTSPGAYVKEFIHGDCGRTQPNLATLVKSCQTEILQLDVIGLYDGFEGGMIHRPSTCVLDLSSSSGNEEMIDNQDGCCHKKLDATALDKEVNCSFPSTIQNSTSRSWEDMMTMPLPSFQAIDSPQKYSL